MFFREVDADERDALIEELTSEFDRVKELFAEYDRNGTPVFAETMDALTRVERQLAIAIGFFTAH